MAYIGRDTDKLSNIEVLDAITFDGSSSYTLQKNSVNFTPSSANNVLVSIDGVVQANNFTVSGSTINFGVAVPSTSTCDWIYHIGVGLITTPADGTVTNAKIASSIITGQTEDTTPADNDLILTYDTSASALKKVQKSNFASSNVEIVTYTTLDSTGVTSIQEDLDWTTNNYYKIEIVSQYELSSSSGVDLRMRNSSGDISTDSYKYIGFAAFDTISHTDGQFYLNRDLNGGRTALYLNAWGYNGTSYATPIHRTEIFKPDAQNRQAVWSNQFTTDGTPYYTNYNYFGFCENTDVKTGYSIFSSANMRNGWYIVLGYKYQ